jgi:hypothetical protein
MPKLSFIVGAFNLPEKVNIPKGAFYTYLWLREDGTPYYAGKGRGANFPCKNRAYRKGSPPAERVLVEFHESEDDAFMAEQVLVSVYGRQDIGTGTLQNRSDGGRGPSGWKMSKEGRERLSLYIKEHPVPRDLKAHSRLMSGTGNPQYGKKRVFDAGWRAKIAAGNTGKKRSESAVLKMKEIKKRWWEEHRPTHCKHGHPFSGANLIVNEKGYRICRTCRIEKNRQYRQRASRLSSVPSTDLGVCAPACAP